MDIIIIGLHCSTS